ncbi:MAG: PASTA domain-containing protein [bacterium]
MDEITGKTVSRKKGFVRWLFISLGIIAGMYIITLLVCGRVIMKRGDEVIVPDVVGLSYEEAEAILKQAELIAVKDGEEDSTYPPGFVVKQRPEAGLKVRKDRKVTLKVSSGTGEIHIPNLVGLPLRQAEMILKRIGLSIGEVQQITSDEVPEGNVISQSPEAHLKAKRGSKVDLLVSLGSEKAFIVMPSVIGLDLPSARKALDELGLKLGEITEEVNPNIPKGRIMRQSPPVGEQVKKGDEVDLVISSGGSQ